MNAFSSGEIAGFCRGLSLLLHAGVGLAEGLYLLAEGENGPRRELLQKMEEQTSGGFRLSEAMEECAVFPAHVVGMLRIGEETGRLEETLESLAKFYEDRERTAGQIKSALTYPSMLLALMLAVIAVLMMEVLPVFDEVYASMGGRMEGIGAGFLRLGELMRASLPVLLAVLAVCAVCLAVYFLNPHIKSRINNAFQSRFGDSGVFRKYNNAFFARALSMCLSSGLPLEEAMQLAKDMLSAAPGAEMRCSQCLQALNEGTELGQAMGDAQLLSGAQSRMLAVGMQGGDADRMMDNIADRAMEDAEDTLEGLVSRIEPTMVLIASLLVGIILLAVMLPLIRVITAIG